MALTVDKSKLLERIQLPDPLGYNVNIEPLFEGEELGEAALYKAARRLGFDGRILAQASYVVVNEKAAVDIMKRRVEREGGYVLGILEALREIPEVRRVAWTVMDPLTDKYTSLIALLEGEERVEGYAVYVPKGVKIGFPLYACMLITKRYGRQLLHNIILLEEDSEATVVTGCAAAPEAYHSLHVGITEIVVGRRARLNYAMIHSWGPDTHVRPRTAVRVDEGGSNVSYYVLYGRVASLHAHPKIRLAKNARGYNATIIVAESGDIYAGTTMLLEGDDSSAEIVSRLVAKKEAKIMSPLRIVAHAKGRGHIECLGVPLSPSAVIVSEPTLEANTDEAELTHEAAIGKLRDEEIEYLMARGLDEETARRLLIKALLHVDVPGIPEQVRVLIRSTERLLVEKGAA